MAKSIGQLASDIFDLLKDESTEDSIRVLKSVNILLGIENTGVAGTSPAPGSVNQSTNNGDTGDAKAFFLLKAPSNRAEEFAVAAMFSQRNNLGDIHTSASLREIIFVKARRKFDATNFTRDMKNCVNQSGYFIKGEEAGQFLLSSGGEEYVNALPNRSAAKEAIQAIIGIRSKPKSAKSKAKAKVVKVKTEKVKTDPKIEQAA